MLDRKIRKKIEWHFYNYEAEMHKAAENEVDVLEDIVYDKHDRSGKHGLAPRPTETRAIRLYTASEAVKWCYVVERTLEYFARTEKEDLIRLKYFEKCSINYISNELYIGRARVFEKLNDTLQFAAIAAAQLGLLKII